MNIKHKELKPITKICTEKMMDSDAPGNIIYTWFDTYGNLVLQGNVLSSAGCNQYQMNSPRQQGFYFLVFNLKTDRLVKKVCVIQ